MESQNKPTQIYLKPIGTYPKKASELSIIELFQNKVQWIQCSISGAMMLGKEALIDDEFKTELYNRLDAVIQAMKSFDDLSDEKKIINFLPILHQQQELIEQIRKVFFNVIKTHKPDKFKARVIEGRDYSHKLQLNFKKTDGINSHIKENLIKFFQDMIVQKIENQFDKLCDEMLQALNPQNIDIQGATERLKNIAKNVQEEHIKSLLYEIAELDENKREKHILFKCLQKKKQDNVKLKQENDIEKQYEIMNTKDFNKDLKKALTQTNKYYDYIEEVTDNFAKEFLVTFYSGEIQEDALDGFDPQPMFIYFIIFIYNHFGLQIPDYNNNLKEFCENTDADGSLDVNLEELSKFFKTFVDQQNKKVYLQMAGVEEQVVQSKKNQVKFKMICKNDFEEEIAKNKGQEEGKAENKGQEEGKAKKRREEEGILKKGVVKELVFENGQHINFGYNNLNDVVIPIDDIDEYAFTIYNRDGQLFLVDKTEKWPVRVKCKPKIKYRLFSNDQVNLGLEQDFQIGECTSEKVGGADKPGFINIRDIPETLSKKMVQLTNDKKHISNKPYMIYTYKSGDLEGEKQEFDDPFKVYTLGRAKDRDVRIDWKGVSRFHCKIYYDKELGWVIEDEKSLGGTWLHPKQFAQNQLGQNSLPMMVRDGMTIKIFTYTLKFKKL